MSSNPALQLNRYCHCVSTDTEQLERTLAGAEATRQIAVSHPHLFSRVAMFVERPELDAMAQLIAAIERTFELPGWQRAVLADAPAIARVGSRARGLFFGYDFHLGTGGPQLIEINTNAGGAFLHAALRQAQAACCDEVRDGFRMEQREQLEQRLLDTFRHEWRLARGDRPLATVAIVDDAPATQFLYPEIELAAALLERHGIRAPIADPRELAVRDGALWCGDCRIDLVYNRLTDFALYEPAHAAVRRAWEQDLAVVSPHPRAHALCADKRNLVLLTDAAFLAGIDVPAGDIAVLQAGIPRTVQVTATNTEGLWVTRKQWFFKPAGGFGSKAVYRGDKLTQGKWREILAAGNYIAQQLVPPSERHIEAGGTALKVDIRNYVYDGRVLLTGARLYQGQTTNMRTPGGGFAAVFAVGG